MSSTFGNEKSKPAPVGGCLAPAQVTVQVTVQVTADWARKITRLTPPAGLGRLDPGPQARLAG